MSEDVRLVNHGEIPIDEMLCLRAIPESEADSLFKLSDDNREYLAEYLSWVDKTNSPEDSLAFIQRIQEERGEGSLFGFGIYYGDQLVGHISLMHVTDGERPEIGYWVSKEHSGKGIATKATKSLAQFGFDTLQLDEIVIKARVDNKASNTIPQKLGYELFKVEHRDDESLNIWRTTNGR